MTFDFRPRGRTEGILVTIASLVLLLGAAAFSLLRRKHPDPEDEDFEEEEEDFEEETDPEDGNFADEKLPDEEDTEAEDTVAEDTEEDIPDREKVSDITDNSGPAEAAREQETSAAENRPEGENE